jgi:hypothetical protein
MNSSKAICTGKRSWGSCKKELNIEIKIIGK